MSERPTVSIVLVSWNVRSLLQGCLTSLERFLPPTTQVVVVDNGSSDGSADMVRTSFPSVHLIAEPGNLGFARGNNRARSVVTGDYVLFLNPDTFIAEDILTPLLAFAKTIPRFGAAGPELLNRDGTHQQSVRRFPRLLDQILILLKLNWLLYWLPFMQRYYADPGARQREPREVDQVMGAALLIPSQVLTEVGWFDDQYPNWWEEVDLCHRIKRAGYSVWYAPVTKVTHIGGSSFRQIVTTRKHRWFLAGLNRYARLFWPRWQAVVVKVLSPVSYALTIVQLLIKPR